MKFSLLMNKEIGRLSNIVKTLTTRSSVRYTNFRASLFVLTELPYCKACHHADQQQQVEDCCLIQIHFC